mgnify:CR=1 FL=1
MKKVLLVMALSAVAVAISALAGGECPKVKECPKAKGCPMAPVCPASTNAPACTNAPVAVPPAK